MTDLSIILRVRDQENEVAPMVRAANEAGQHVAIPDGRAEPRSFRRPNFLQKWI